MEVTNITINDSLFFTFNGIKSKTLNMLNVTLSGGMQSEYFASSQSIIEEKIRGRDKRYFQGKEKSPLQLTVNFAFEESWTDDDLRYVRRWLSEPEYYVPLTFSNDIEKVFYVLYEDEPELLHNSLNQGYISIRFRCNDSYAYSPLMLHPQYEPYEWQENIVNISVDDFTEGVHKQTVVNANDELSLSSAPKRWRDLPLHLTWREMFQSVL